MLEPRPSFFTGAAFNEDDKDPGNDDGVLTEGVGEFGKGVEAVGENGKGEGLGDMTEGEPIEESDTGVKEVTEEATSFNSRFSFFGSCGSTLR